MKQTRLLLFIVAGVATVAMYRWLFPSPDTQIRAHLQQLKQSLTIEGKEAPLQGKIRANEVAKLFSKSPVINLQFEYRGPFAIKTRQDIADHLLLVRRHLKYLGLEFKDLNLKANSDNSYTATLNCIAHFSQEEGHSQSIPFVFEFRDDEGDWLIHNVKNKLAIEL